MERIDGLSTLDHRIQRKTVYNANDVKTVLLFMMLTLFLAWMGQLLAGWTGFFVALAGAALIHTALSRWTGMGVLRLYGAQELVESDDPELFWIIDHLSQWLNRPRPRLYLIPEEAPNAFTLGRNADHGAIVLTTGLQRILDRDEQSGVIAHELAHLKNGDTPIMTLVALLAGLPVGASRVWRQGWANVNGRSDLSQRRGVDSGMIEYWARRLVMPVVALLIRCRLTGAQELEADELAAQATGEPLALASALQKIESALEHAPMQGVTPATGHLFIINPYANPRRMWMAQTHPSTAERVAFLEDLAQQQDLGFAS